MARSLRKVCFVFLALLVLSGCQSFRRQRRPGALRVSSQPVATVYLEGISKGTTPYYDEQLDEGEYLIRLSADEVEWSGKVRVISGVETVVNRELAQDPAAEAGEVIVLESGQGLAVITEPNAAAAILDGQEVGQTPWVDTQVSAGEHVVVLRLPGYQERMVRVNVRNGYRLTINMELAAEFAVAQPAPTPAPPDPIATSVPMAEPSGPAAIIQETGTSFGLRVRSGPGLNHSILTNVKPGEVFPILEERADWIKIRLSDGSEGWVSSRYTSRR